MVFVELWAWAIIGRDSPPPGFPGAPRGARPSRISAMSAASPTRSCLAALPCLAAQTRHTCVSALCKMALRLPEPVRFDVYCFLKGLAGAADVFSFIARGGDTSADAAEMYWRAQEELADKIEAGESGAPASCRVRHDSSVRAFRGGGWGLGVGGLGGALQMIGYARKFLVTIGYCGVFGQFGGSNREVYTGLSGCARGCTREIV